ncbi:MAG: diaminopimelate epimerase [Chitinophagaceae bacterium]
MNIAFYKFQGTGNDFVMMDNRQGSIELTPANIRFLTDRKFGIGADGVILLTDKKGYDFEMTYFNPDGTQTFCGNGGRCAVQFASAIGIKKDKYVFTAADGDHEATIADTGWVSLKMKDVNGMKKIYDDFLVNTGVPHYVKFVENAKGLDVVENGKKIRYSPEFITDGVNVNFVQQLDDSEIFVRTYERGVEDETLSCGTGVTAAALVSAHNDRGFNRVDVETLGGNLAVEYDKLEDDIFNNIWLCGPAVNVYRGEVIIPNDLYVSTI